MDTITSMEGGSTEACDLWVVGAGTLGEAVIKQWMTKFPDARVVAETKSLNKHSLLQSYGCIPALRSDRSSASIGSARNVVIALTPSSDDYINELAEACRLWAGPQTGGLVLTSSIGIYGEATGRIINEDSPVDSSSIRTQTMITAEEQVRQARGAVIRLSGLYNLNKGPDVYWLKSGKPIEGAADGLINMIHYDDAASAVIAALDCFDKTGIHEYMYIFMHVFMNSYMQYKYFNS